MNILRKGWSRIFKYNSIFGLFLILLFGVPRFYLVLEANILGSYGFVSIIFIIMWFIPFVLLTKDGRRKIGFKKPDRIIKLIYAFLVGIIFCSIAYSITKLLYGGSIDNSFVYISGTYTIPGEVLANGRLIPFLSFAIIGMIFSPIGEEFFYRGVVHGSFVEQFGERKASYFDSLAFAVTHLAHFGVVYNAGHWEFLFFPALLWLALMFGVSQLFFRCKVFCDSIWGAVVCHAGFNFAMTYFIIYHIL